MKTTSHSSHRRFFLFAPLSFFVPIPRFPQRNFAPGSLRNDDRQLARPTTSPVLSLLMRTSLSQSRSMPASDRLQGNLGLLWSALDCLPCCFICFLPQGSGSGLGTGLLIQTSQ